MTFTYTNYLGRAIDVADFQKNLPKGWVWTRLGELVQPSSEKIAPLEIKNCSYIGLEHIEKDTGKLLGRGHSADVRSTKTKFYRGDLLYGKLRPYLNKVYVAYFDGVCSTDILVFSRSSCLSNKYLSFRFLCSDFVKYSNQNVSGVQHPRVDFKVLSRFDICLPPLPEQHRIVSKLEELFTKLDAGAESLKKAKAELKRYRQSVLKAAFEGKLTETWRKAHNKGELEPASVLLERIKEERKKKLGRKYKELLPADTSDLPKLPEGWKWASAEQLTTIITDGEHITPERSESGVLLLSARNILDGKLTLKDVDYVPQHVYNKLSQRLKIEPGDVLLSCSGSVGRSCVAPEGLTFSLVRSVAVLKPVIKAGNYLSYCLRSHILQSQIIEKKTQTAQANIFQGKIKSLKFPIPPLAEQHRIVAEIERRFSVVEGVEKTVERGLVESGRLRQSILKRAFEGKLVPQDPKDEPAQLLLERIRAHKKKGQS